LFEALLKWVEHGERDLPEVSDEPEVEGPQEAALPELPGIDTESGLARLGGKVRSYTKLLGKFVGNQAGAIAEIRTALAESDGERAVRAAHTLKGVSGSLGAQALQLVSAKLEAALKEENNPETEALIVETGAELDRVITTLEIITDPKGRSSSSSGTSPSAPEGLATMIGALIDKVNEYDSEAEEALEEILDLEVEPSLRAEFSAVGALLGQYDFESASTALNTIGERFGISLPGDIDGGTNPKGQPALPSGSSASAPAGLASKIGVLIEKVNEYDSEAEEALDEILELKLEANLRAEFVAVGELLGQYEFESAATALNSVSERFGIS
jgi:HPt (histidine-containing phosphotransfer) domain-containing protein